jgi:predicted nucleic-acid-binding Zn-ribbon protein
MKQTGVCPKCASRHIVRVPSEFGTANQVKLGAFELADVTRYVCVSCGFMEQYIEDEPALAKVRGRERTADAPV